MQHVPRLSLHEMKISGIGWNICHEAWCVECCTSSYGALLCECVISDGDTSKWKWFLSLECNSAIHVSMPLLEWVSRFLLDPLQVLSLKIASYQHRNIHKLRHNGQNTAWILKYVCVREVGAAGDREEGRGRGGTSVSIQAHLWHIPWPWSLCTAWWCSLGFVYGSQLVYYEAQRQPWRDVGPRCFISCQGLLQLN